MKKIDDFFNYRRKRYNDVTAFRDNKKSENDNIEKFGVGLVLDTLSEMRTSSNNLLDFNMLPPEKLVDKTVIKCELMLFDENRRNPKSYTLTFFVKNNGKEKNMTIELCKGDDLYDEQEKFNTDGRDYDLITKDELESDITELLIKIREFEFQNENPGLPNNY